MVLIRAGEVLLSQIGYGKYAGRLVADVTTANGVDVAGALLAAGLARSWNGRGARPQWCR